jgi:hypothetical protein
MVPHNPLVVLKVEEMAKVQPADGNEVTETESQSHDYRMKV